MQNTKKHNKQQKKRNPNISNRRQKPGEKGQQGKPDRGGNERTDHWKAKQSPEDKRRKKKSVLGDEGNSMN